MTRRALITGGAGFLGSHLCERLLADGWEVECVDNLLTGSEANLDPLFGHPRFTFRHADVSREPMRREDALPLDAIAHLACPASPVHYAKHPMETLEASAVGTQHVLDLARRDGARFLLASTSEVYGEPLVHPQPETYWGNVDPVGPRSMYDEGKRYAEAFATWHARTQGTDVRIVRIFNTYGPRMHPRDGRVVPTFVRQALTGEPLSVHGDGSQTRSFCFVSDLIEGLVRAIEAPPGRINERPTNLGNPVERTMLEIAEAVVAATRSSSPIAFVERPPGDPSRRRPDITRAGELLGWEPRIELEQGLRETVAWARANVGWGRNDVASGGS